MSGLEVLVVAHPRPFSHRKLRPHVHRYVYTPHLFSGEVTVEGPPALSPRLAGGEGGWPSSSELAVRDSGRVVRAGVTRNKSDPLRGNCPKDPLPEKKEGLRRS